MKKRYDIEVDCANCAAKIEAAVAKLPGIEAVSINYMAQKMTLEVADTADMKALLASILKTGRKIEPDFSIEA